jgi:hypothetical protein
MLAVLIMARPTPAEAQGSWDRYAPGSLTAIIQRHIASIDTTSGAVPSFIVSAQTFPTRATLIFGGKTRPIPDDDRRVLVMWARGAQIDTTRVYEYREEWLFLEGSAEHWLPVQEETAESMKGAIAAGDSVTVWAQWFGAVTRSKVTTWVFPVMKAESYE